MKKKISEYTMRKTLFECERAKRSLEMAEWFLNYKIDRRLTNI